MKMLLIGIDGAQANTFKRGWTPYIESLVDRGSKLQLTEDLISRGWAEILTGEYATKTGALYELPTLDGTHAWTDKFQIRDIPGLGTDVRPLWQALNEMGYRVGIMNVPTTNPAPQVDGYFVAGGGGGGPIDQKVLPEQCWPGGLEDDLNENGYILDERLPTLLGQDRLFNPEDFFFRMTEMASKRADTFIRLSGQYDVDFGFVVFKSSSVVTETLLLPELYRQASGEKRINEQFIAAAKKYYHHFDTLVQRVIDAFPSAETILVSDHGTVRRQWSVNFNAFLQEAGYQDKSTSRRGVFQLIHGLKRLAPYSIRQKLKRNTRIKYAYESLTPFDPATTRAFNITLTNNIHGMYINDSRFNGPVEDRDIAKTRNGIIERFNRHPLAAQHGLVARAADVPNGEYSRHYPDIVVDLPDGYAPFNNQKGFIEKYTEYDKPIDLKDFVDDLRVSVKSHTPLAVIGNGEWKVSPTDGKNDLRLIYDHVVASFQEYGRR